MTTTPHFRPSVKGVGALHRDDEKKKDENEKKTKKKKPNK
jgi:hypothetical protein